MASSSLQQATAHAVAFLTARLAAKYPPATLNKLQMVLDANLTAHYAPSWNPAEPVRGSGARCMALSPDQLPPRPIWSACTATSVQWFDWMRAYGNKPFDLFVDPGCVAIRRDGQIITIWSDEPAPKAPAKPLYHAPVFGKTFAQQVVEADKAEEEHIFHLLADEMTAPTWTTPIVTHFPIPRRSASPLSSVSEHSRCSSRSSNSSSSGFSFASDTASSRTSASAKSSPGGSDYKPSRRERARQARVFVDTSKTEVTPYDGGKTTVLTGGVMLGGASAKPNKKLSVPSSGMSSSASWRSTRA
ncbi:unnamed protein product [Cyclocybe aegerita]|uniref:Anti-proliferative protein domain-containing protein n=1 Tax=Cyclocybe aegerita TaxID=1973307 RepID=A0A8S0WUM4_CYCAE|nr:unnamed protein product [Cyclocybe aegerita]